MKTVLITGANGLLGQKFVKLAIAKNEFRIIGTGRGACRLPYQSPNFQYISMDLAIEQEVHDTLARYKPDVVVHAAAMTNVDACELNKIECWTQNVLATQYLVEACKAQGSHLVHVSTDFIFDGKEGPLTEEATPAPISFYGYSKLVAEELVQQGGLASWSIVRTVLVYGISHDMSRSNIVLWAKQSLENKKEIKVVDDQWRTPTLAEDLAMGCYLLVSSGKQGIYNISGADFLHPYDMVMQVAKYFGLATDTVSRANSGNFSQAARRPPITGLVIDKAMRELGYRPHTFDEGIALLARQIQDPGLV